MNNPKTVKVIVEIITAAGIAQGVLPQLTAVSHVPAWVGIALGAIVQVGHAILTDTATPPPDAPAK
jgi:hypothetical protein